MERIKTKGIDELSFCIGVALLVTLGITATSIKALSPTHVYPNGKVKFAGRSGDTPRLATRFAVKSKVCNLLTTLAARRCLYGPDVLRR